MSTRLIFRSAAAALLVAPVAACGASDSSSALEIIANVTDRASMESVVEAFRNEHPDVEVKVAYEETDTLQKSLGSRLASGEGPDVFTVWPGSGNPASVQALVRQKHLRDLSTRRFSVLIPEGAEPVTKIDLHTYVVPVNYSGIGVIYSSGSLKRLGAVEPRTWDELLTLCEKAREDGSPLLALGNKTPWVTQLVSYALAATTVYGKTPDFDEKLRFSETSFSSSGWKVALEKYQEMNSRGCFNGRPLATTYEQTLRMVAKGDAVGVVQVASSLSEIQDASPGEEFGFFALPADNDPENTRMPGAVSAAYGVNAKSDRMTNALKFVDFLGSATGQNLYNQGGATLPAIPNDEFKANPALAELAERQRNGTTVPFMDQLWPHPGVQQEHFEQIRNLFNGQATPESALAAMDQAYRTRPE
ncbi:ABC transporter substrate-binding protein [Streptomyces sp. NPDC054995]